MLVIRLTRVGKRNAPSFRVVLAEKHRPVKGKFIELLGYYNPRLKTRGFKKERILYWLKQGAQCSATVHNLLIDEKIVEGAKVKAWSPKRKKPEEKEKPKMPKAKPVKLKEEAPKEEPEVKEKPVKHA